MLGLRRRKAATMGLTSSSESESREIKGAPLNVKLSVRGGPTGTSGLGRERIRLVDGEASETASVSSILMLCFLSDPVPCLDRLDGGGVTSSLYGS